MNIEEIKELLARFDQSTLTEFDLKEDAFGLYMNKNTVSQKSMSTESTESKKTSENVGTPSQETDVTVVTEKNEPIKVSSENTEAIVSPIVGIVYLKPAPDKPNFKQVGDQVKKGEVVCIVEAMKLMNEITATTDGVITEILVDNEAVVEFNQPLFRISKGV